MRVVPLPPAKVYAPCFRTTAGLGQMLARMARGVGRNSSLWTSNASAECAIRWSCKRAKLCS